jgi:GNAT superfamily N-acetyltransferase
MAYSLPPLRNSVRLMVTSEYSIGSAPSELSIVSCTSARPSGPRVEVPAKMTSSILPPRSVFTPCSPMTQASASTTFDLPEPLGPTTHVTPVSKANVVGWAKDLNPLRVRLFRYTSPPAATPRRARSHHGTRRIRRIRGGAKAGRRGILRAGTRDDAGAAGGVMAAIGFEIDELRLPESLDGPGGADFAEMVHVHNVVEAAAYGTDMLALRADELLPQYRFQQYDRRRLFLARTDGLVVGRGVLEWSTDEDDPASWFVVEVLPEFRGRGIGTALADAVERIHAESGRPVLQGFVAHAFAAGGIGVRQDGGPEVLVPPTGYGRVRVDDPGARFLRARGMTLEQVSRGSALQLPVDPGVLARHRARAEMVAGPEYRVLLWSGGTAEDRRADMAALYTRMSTAEPLAGLATIEARWDETRVVEEEDAMQGGGRTLLTAAAEHVPSGRLVAFTRLSVPLDRSRPTEQEETLVFDEHRGRRLGMLLKAANLQYLAEEAPETPLVFTFNAEENRHMLRVNEALGFTPIGYEGSWKKSTPRR